MFASLNGWRAVCALLLALLVVEGLSHWYTSARAHQVRQALANCTAARAADMARWAEASRASEARERAREQAAAAAVAKERTDGIARAAAAERRAADLAGAADRLREHVARLAAGSGGEPGPTAPAAGDSPPAPAAGVVPVLWELYRGADEEARSLAVALDAARAAGLGCERLYSEVTGGNGSPDRQD